MSVTIPEPLADAGSAASLPVLPAEVVRLIGNARSHHNVCVLARGRYGMAEFGRLFYLLADLDDERLGRCLDLVDEVRRTHAKCLRCTIKFVAFCRFYCGIQLPRRLEAYERRYDRLVDLFGRGRDFMGEVGQAIEEAKPEIHPNPPPGARLRHHALKVFPTEIRFFRGDFER
jgi:hypothetical protein